MFLYKPCKQVPFGLMKPIGNLKILSYLRNIQGFLLNCNRLQKSFNSPV